MTENKKDKKIEQKFYTIPLRDVVIFPKMTITILHFTEGIMRN